MAHFRCLRSSENKSDSSALLQSGDTAVLLIDTGVEKGQRPAGDNAPKPREDALQKGLRDSQNLKLG